ncbi:MAG: OmpW family outer membrane protein [Pseudomonadota bacterium]
MKIFSKLPIIILLSFIIVFVSINANASDDTSAANLTQIIGIKPDADSANIDMLNAAEGTEFMATVEEPSKIGGCLKGDRVKLINIKNAEWKIIHIASGSSFNFLVSNEAGILKIRKTESFSDVRKFKRLYYEKYDKGMEQRLGIGIRVSYVNFSDDDYNVGAVQVNVGADEAAMFGVNLTYTLDRYFSLELSVDYFETDAELSALGLSGSAGKLTSIPVLLSIRVHPATDPKIKPYFSFGGGYFFNSLDSNPSAAVAAVYGPGANFDVDNSFAFFVGAGVEVFFSKNIALNIDCKYIWTEAKGSVKVAGFSDEDLRMNPFVAGIGLKYYF